MLCKGERFFLNLLNSNIAYQPEQQDFRKEIEQFLDLEYDNIFAFCLYRMHYNCYDAEDLMHDTLLELQKKWAIINPVLSSRKSWCMSTVFNKSNEIFRKQKKFGGELIPFTEEIANQYMQYEQDMDANQITDAEIAGQKDAALSLLNEKERILYMNTFQQKKKQAEIAAEEGVSVDTIAKRCERLRKKLLKITKEMIEKWP